MNKINNILVITWDGIQVPFKYVYFDVPSEFQIILFNYSGIISSVNEDKSTYIITEKTENKGQVLSSVYNFIKSKNLEYNYIGIIDDDIIFKISEFNYMIHIAMSHDLDVFQPSISRDSFYSHRNFIHTPQYLITNTTWVEIMAPFYKKELFEACGLYFDLSISSQGLDCFMMPVLQRVNNLNNTAIVHTAIIKHTRPIRTHLRTYSNGLTGLQEIELIRQKALEIVNDPRFKDKFDKSFIRLVLMEGNPYFIEIEVFYRKMCKLFKNAFFQVKQWAQ
jgi:hypothetical protein